MVVPDIHWALITITLCFMLLDFVTGFVQACVNHDVQSTVMKSGLFHKCGFVLAIVFACLCEYTMSYVDMGFTVPIQDAVCVYIIATEIVSNLENLGKISPELSESKFMEIFEQHRKA